MAGGINQPGGVVQPRADRSILVNTLVSPPATTPITKAVPGVQINREFGEGERVSVRGLAPNLTRTLLNGHGLATADWFILEQLAATRSFNYLMLPADIIGQVQVFKSPTADIDEGGVGGMLAEHLGSSVEAERALAGWHAGWATEFGAQAQGLGRTFTHEILGFGGTLAIVSRFVDRTCEQVDREGGRGPHHEREEAEQHPVEVDPGRPRRQPPQHRPRGHDLDEPQRVEQVVGRLLGQRASLRLEWERLEANADVDLVTLGVAFRF